MDGLERQAGLDPAYLVEAHGSSASAHCANPVRARSSQTAVRVQRTVLTLSARVFPGPAAPRQACGRPCDHALFLGERCGGQLGGGEGHGSAAVAVTDGMQR